MTTSAMDDVRYDRRDFTYDPRDHRHPLYLTERWFLYHLREDKLGCLVPAKDSQGNIIRSPRNLREVCIYRLVTEAMALFKLRAPQGLPSNVYPLLMSEAILQRETQTIEWLVSTWPLERLVVYEVLPLEDYLDDYYLTLPFEGNEKACLADCFVLGLLKLKPESHLKSIDFSRFEKDRKLCRELCRLPLLWMKPEDREVDTIFQQMSQSLEVTKDKVQKFLNRISVVYSNVDGEFEHGREIRKLTINLDMKVSLDDVPLGLSLQRWTPFSFTCGRLWVQPITDVSLTLHSLLGMVSVKQITHFEHEDPSISQDDVKLTQLLTALKALKSLQACSLPSVIDSMVNQEMPSEVGQVLSKLTDLQRLNLSFCNLKDHLACVLQPLRQRIKFLNLKDCRLSTCDLQFLSSWRGISSVRELNVSSNCLKNQEELMMSVLRRTPRLICLSMSYCSLDASAQRSVCRELCTSTSYLKVLCTQSYTPLPEGQTLDLLKVCCDIRNLQKITLFPEVYAFPGENEHEREWNKYHILRLCYHYLSARGLRAVQVD